MGVDYYMVCKGCGKDWPFFRASAGGCYVDPEINNDPLRFWEWMTDHAEHGEVVAVSEHDIDLMELPEPPEEAWPSGYQ